MNQEINGSVYTSVTILESSWKTKQPTLVLSLTYFFLLVTTTQERLGLWSVLKFKLKLEQYNVCTNYYKLCF